ncbi:hypothetical protein HDV04_004870 [Boothiomyces sp. JEL0838]|nr:hypothetical protein HDV04_004870 [Boothiomyces sp. JEL0838]
MLFAEFYNNYFYSNFVAGIIVAFLEPTLIYGVALTNIRILKLYQKVDPDITDQLLKVANWLFSILYALPIIFLIIAYSLNINTLLKAGSYAILAFSVIVVIYNTAQGIYLISFVYNKNTSREKAKLVTEFRKATFIIVFMIMLDTAGIICFSIPQFIETDKNTNYLAVIIATSLTGIHYSSMQVMFKQISELSSQAPSKPPSAFSNWIGQLWKISCVVQIFEATMLLGVAIVNLWVLKFYRSDIKEKYGLLVKIGVGYLLSLYICNIAIAIVVTIKPDDYLSSVNAVIVLILAVSVGMYNISQGLYLIGLKTKTNSTERLQSSSAYRNAKLLIRRHAI